MGTRSDILVKMKNGKWGKIYCHWDGYISHNGVILQEHYNSQAKAEKLIELGDLSLLGKKCSKPKGHSFDKPVRGYCVAYGRDRGETGCEANYFDTLEECYEHSNEYTYIFDGKDWKVYRVYIEGSIDNPELLRDAIAKDKEAEDI